MEPADSRQVSEAGMGAGQLEAEAPTAGDLPRAGAEPATRAAAAEPFLALSLTSSWEF